MAHITARLAAARRPKKKSAEPPVRRRVTLLAFDADKLRLPIGRHYKGEFDRLRRILKMRRSRSTFVYANGVRESGTLVLSNFPLEREDLVGCYTGVGLTTGQLREDFAEMGVQP